ncbi:TonB-dependent receptor domain-containing protein [Agaribacterium sp. ZY112]|uniref:TonB-dependent receptor domain-containing protein n=1 Tax=Agaribacterium sp. ZY112 TaxID=3233574 RepID=UPI003525AAF0
MIVKFTHKPLALACSVLAMSAVSAAAQANVDGKGDVEQMVVTATTTEHDLATAPASVSVITAEDIQSMPVANIGEALEHSVGLTLQRNGSSGRSAVRIRGLESSYTLILINGNRTGSANALIRGNDFDLSSIPLDSIERVEVIRGPMSSLYGSDAMGGVVNIITKQSSEDWTGDIRAEKSLMQEGEGGDQTRVSGYASGAIVKDKLLAKIAVDYYDRDEWLVYPEPASANSGIEGKEASSILVGLDYLLSDTQSLKFDLTKVEDQREYDWYRGPALQNTQQESDRLTVNLAYKGKFDWADSQVRYSYEEFELLDQSTAYAGDTRTPDGTANATQTNNNIDVLFNSKLGKHLLSYGAEYRTTELASDRDMPFGAETISQSAAFVQGELDFGRLGFTLGGRVDNHEDYGTHFSPRAYVVFSATDNLVIKGGVGSGFKAPELFQYTEGYTVISCRNQCYLTGNPDLDPEKNTAYELSALYQADRWSFGGGYFHNEVTDKLYRDATTMVGIYPGDGVTPMISYINLSKAEYKGWEFDASVDIIDSLRLSANYTVTDAKDTDTDLDLDYVPESSANVKLDWQVISNLSTFVSYRYVGEQTISAEKVPSYGVVDLGGSLDITDSFNVKLGVTNLNNVLLFEEDENFDYLERGQSVYLSAGYSF